MNKTRGINLTKEMVKQAVSEVATIVGALAEKGVLEGFRGHFVIMDPNRPYGEYPFEEAILHESSFTDAAYPWKYDYKVIARAKAMASWATGLSSRELMALNPLFAEDGDAPWAGSIVVKFHNGQILVIAFSGLQSEDDEWVDWMLESRLWALSYKRIPDDSLVGGHNVDVKQ